MLSLFKRNLAYKLASIGFAVALWVTVVVIGQTVVSVEVPLEYVNLNEGVLVADVAQRNLTLTLKGHERLLHAMGPDTLKVRLDMSGLGVGRHSYQVEDRHIKHPATLRLVSVKPSLLNIRLEERVTREVPVRAVITGLPMKGYAVNGVEVTPGTVEASGGKSLLSRLRRLDAGPVDVSGASTDVAEEVVISHDAGVSLSEDSVMITVVIRKE